MNIADILIYLAGVLFILTGIPQIVKLIKTKITAGISLPYFVLVFLGISLLIVGNTLTKNWAVVIAHIIPLINIIAIVVLVLKYRRDC